MAAARAGWKRIAAVYGLVEQMRAAELRGAAWAVDEAEAALRREAEALAGRRGGVAFVEGSGVDWAVGGTSREYGEARMEVLEEMKVEREEAMDAAGRAHRESRVRTEQMKSVVERAGRAAAETEARRAQGAADDRFAGQRWVKGRGKM